MSYVYGVFSMVGENNGGPTHHLLSIHYTLMGAIRYLNAIGNDGIDLNELVFPNNGTSYVIGKREDFDDKYVEIGTFGGFLIEEIQVKA